MPPYRDLTPEELEELGGPGLTPSGMSPEQFTQERQQFALEDIKRGTPKLAHTAINLAATGASAIPGVGPIAGAAISGAGTTLSQLLGYEPRDATQIAISAGLPLAAGGALGALKAGTKGAAELLGPGAVRRAGVGGAAKAMGFERQSINRIFATPASRRLFSEAQKLGKVDHKPITKALDDAVFEMGDMANPSTGAMQYITNISDKFKLLGRVDYGDVMNEMQQLNKRIGDAFQAGDSVNGTALRMARIKALDVLDRASPKLRNANAMFRKESALNDVLGAMRKEKSIEAVETLFETDPLVRGAFDRPTTKAIHNFAESITGITTSPAGLAGRVFQTVVSPVARALDQPAMRYLLEQLMKPNKRLTEVGLATLAQYARTQAVAQ